MQDSVLLTIEQPLTAGLIDQLMPAPVGSASLSVTPVAVPGPLLFSVIVKPMLLPAFTLAASAVFVICRLGHCTVTDALAVTGRSRTSVAVLLYVPQLAAVVLKFCALAAIDLLRKAPVSGAADAGPAHAE